ncbi:MAG: hypothetical protein AB4352_19590 [Hormoscilla sp.]
MPAPNKCDRPHEVLLTESPPNPTVGIIPPPVKILLLPVVNRRSPVATR